MKSISVGLSRGIKEVVVEVISEIGKKYNLDVEEMKSSLGIEIKMKKEKKSEIILPFTGRINESDCKGIKMNYGLYNQCSNNIFKNSLCKTCKKQSEKNSNGKPNLGTIDERLDKNYTDKNGKKPIKYSKYMEKMNLTREMVEKEAKEQCIEIPEEEFEIEKPKRGRPKKSISTTDTSDEESIAEPKKRGRPPKEKKVIENGNAGDDLIKNLIEEANKVHTPPKVDTPPNVDAPPKVDELTKECLDDEEDSDDEEETVVVPFVFKGVKYLKAADNTIYDNETHEEVGVWNEEKQDIVPDDDDDED